MKFQSLPISSTYQRFRALAGRLRKTLRDGSFKQMDQSDQMDLIQKLRLMYRRLCRVMSKRKLMRSLASAAILLGLQMSDLNAQSFGPPQINPFGLSPTEDYLFVPDAVDIDGDGDLDIIGTGYASYDNSKLIYFENIGSAIEPAFSATPVENPFNFPQTNELTSCSFGDLDGDGDLDLIVGQEDSTFTGVDGKLIYFENTGNMTTPVFATGVDDPFGIQPNTTVPNPEFVDLDGDGDLDIVGADYDSYNERINFVFFENTGTITTPAFSSGQINPFGLVAVESNTPIHTFIDMDSDGDYDILYGNNEDLEIGDTYQASLVYLENTGTASDPTFAVEVINPFDIEFPNESTQAFPMIADFDDDGDLDLMTFTYVYMDPGPSNVFVYFENEGSVNTTELESIVDWKLSPTITNDVITWELPGTLTGTYTMDLYSATGQGLKSLIIADSIGTLSLSDHPAGMYLIQLRDDDGHVVETRKVIKQ